MDLRSIPTLPMGEINYDVLAQELDQNRDYPAIINVNIGTTVKGAVDNLDRIIDTLTSLNIPRERYHIHCDGALFALMMPFIDNAPEISFQKPIDSIAVSGHKMVSIQEFLWLIFLSIVIISDTQVKLFHPSLVLSAWVSNAMRRGTQSQRARGKG
jgi:glutamate/tyrosine decarboxylase-like PLP-dependent enzyme